MDDVSGGFSAGHEPEGEPEFEAPPVLPDQDERRMHVRAYNRWASLLNGREFPAPADLNSGEVDDFGPNSVLIDFREGRETPILRFIGARLCDECGLDEKAAPGQGLDISSVPARSLLSRLTDHYFEIIANRAPIGFEAEFTSRRGNNTLYRGILTPLSSDGSTVDYMYGVINWKELAEAELGDSLVREAGLGTNVTLAEAARIGMPAAPDAGDMEARPGLADRLAKAREAADQMSAANERSRAALYAVLSSAWDFYLGAERAPEDYAELLHECGVKLQARAPMTPIVKLIFGVAYDKTRLTEFAAALSHAKRLGVAEGDFAQAIAGFDGGLKGMVKAERGARRAETSRLATDRAAETRSRLRTSPPVAQLPLDIGGDEEFVLLLTRRNGEGALDVMGAVPHKDSLLDTALRTL